MQHSNEIRTNVFSYTFSVRICTYFSCTCKLNSAIHTYTNLEITYACIVLLRNVLLLTSVPDSGTPRSFIILFHK